MCTYFVTSTSNITGYPGDLKFLGRMEVPPLDSDLGQGAGEEANSPAGGARGVGGVVVGGVQFHQQQDCDFKHCDI